MQPEAEKFLRVNIFFFCCIPTVYQRQHLIWVLPGFFRFHDARRPKMSKYSHRCCFPAWGIMGSRVTSTRTPVISTTTSVSVCGEVVFHTNVTEEKQIRELKAHIPKTGLTFRHFSSDSSSGYRAILWIQDGCLRTTWPSSMSVGRRQAGLVIQSFILSRRCCGTQTAESDRRRGPDSSSNHKVGTSWRESLPSAPQTFTLSWGSLTDDRMCMAWAELVSKKKSTSPFSSMEPRSSGSRKWAVRFQQSHMTNVKGRVAQAYRCWAARW